MSMALNPSVQRTGTTTQSKPLTDTNLKIRLQQAYNGKLNPSVKADVIKDLKTHQKNLKAAEPFSMTKLLWSDSPRTAKLDKVEKALAHLGAAPVQSVSNLSKSSSSFFEAATSATIAGTLLHGASSIASAAAENVTQLVEESQIAAKSSDGIQLAVRACIPQLMPHGGCEPDPYSLIPQSVLTAGEFINSTVINGTTYTFVKFPEGTSVMKSALYAFGEYTQDSLAEAVNFFTGTCGESVRAEALIKGLGQEGTAFFNSTQDYVTEYPPNGPFSFTNALMDGTKFCGTVLDTLSSSIASSANFGCSAHDDGGDSKFAPWKIGLIVGAGVLVLGAGMLVYKNRTTKTKDGATPLLGGIDPSI